MEVNFKFALGQRVRVRNRIGVITFRQFREWVDCGEVLYQVECDDGSQFDEADESELELIEEPHGD